MKLTNKIQAIAIVCLFALVAFRPWGDINRAVGIKPPMDSTTLAYDTLAVDSSLVMAQPALQITLPQQAVDTLEQAFRRRDSVRLALQEKIKHLERETSTLKKSVQKRQQELVSIKEVDELIKRQNAQKYGHEQRP